MLFLVSFARTNYVLLRTNLKSTVMIEMHNRDAFDSQIIPFHQFFINHGQDRCGFVSGA